MEKKLKIYYTSDVHGYLFPTDFYSKEMKCMGLLACGDEYDKDENTLIIDGGDMLQGSAYSYYCHRKEDNFAFVNAMNQIGYDFITIGNHDFNYGVAYLEQYLSRLKGKCVCQNIRDRRDGSLPFGWVIIEMKNNLKVGIVGIVTDFINLWEREENLGFLEIVDPWIAAKEALVEMEGKVDISICVYHGGYERNILNDEIIETSGENVGYEICKNLGYDLLLTGHQHMSVWGRYLFGTYTIQPPCYGEGYCELVFTVKKNTVTITSEIKKPKLIRKNWMDDWKQRYLKFQKWLDHPIGYLKQELLPQDKLRMALYGSPIADFINKIMLEITGADISCTSLANEVGGFHKEVTIRDVLTTYPFANTLVVLEVSGYVLKAALERSAEYFQVKDDEICIDNSFLIPKKEHYNYDYFYGITYERNIYAMKGKRISEIKYKGRKIKMEDKFSLCMNHYRASGAGGYDMYVGCNVLQRGTKEITEKIMEYFLKKEGKIFIE